MEKFSNVKKIVLLSTSTLAVALFINNQRGNTFSSKFNNDSKVYKTAGVSLGLTSDVSTTLLSNVKKGKFNIGAIGHNFKDSLEGLELKEVIRSYTQDITDNAKIGEHFLSLPTNFWLKSSPIHYEIDSKSYLPSIAKEILESFKIFVKAFRDNFVVDELVTGSPGKFATPAEEMMFIPKGSFDDLFHKYDWESNSLVPSDFAIELYKTLPNTFSVTDLSTNVKAALTKTNLDSTWVVENSIFSQKDNKYQNIENGKKKITFLNNSIDPAALAQKTKSINYKTLPNSKKTGPFSKFSSQLAKSEIEKGLSLKNSKLSTLLIDVKDKVHNSEEYYKSLVEKNEFKNTNILMIGDKSKNKSGASSKVFAGNKISTAKYNEYLSAYMAGFQSAISQLSYSKEDKKYEETEVSFFIGALKNSTSKKKAFAFRRGVEAAADHPSFSPYLKAYFVSKTADDRETGKKLYYDINEWTEDNKIADFTGSDDFQSGSRKVAYIAGSTASDWRGDAKHAAHEANRPDVEEKWHSKSNFGLIGSILKYNSSGQASKSTKLINVVLDRLDAVEYDYTSTIDRDHTLQDKSDASVVDNFERDNFKLLGVLGKESEATKIYSELYLQAVYNLNNATYMLGKHTLFGGPLDIKWSTLDKNNKMIAFKDFDMLRFLNSTRAAYSKELNEAALVSSAPWIQ